MDVKLAYLSLSIWLRYTFPSPCKCCEGRNRHIVVCIGGGRRTVGCTFKCDCPWPNFQYSWDGKTHSNSSWLRGKNVAEYTVTTAGHHSRHCECGDIPVQWRRNLGHRSGVSCRWRCKTYDGRFHAIPRIRPWSGRSESYYSTSSVDLDVLLFSLWQLICRTKLSRRFSFTLTRNLGLFRNREYNLR